MNSRKSVLVSLFLLSSMVLGGCEGDDTDDAAVGSTGSMEGEAESAGGDASAGGGGDGDGGESDCTPPGLEDSPTICAAGQYCADSVLAECQNGCLSNANCASDQVCELPEGESVGACANVQSAVPESEFCEKFISCGGVDAAACNMFYAATSSECHQCILDENCIDVDALDGACSAPCGL